MKFIKAEEIQKHWFSDEKNYEEVLKAISTCLGKHIIFAQVKEDTFESHGCFRYYKSCCD